MAIQNQKPASSKPAASTGAGPSINKLYTPQMVYQNNAVKAAVNQSNVSERKDPANKQQSAAAPAKGTGGGGNGTILTDPTKHGDGTTLTDPAKHGQAPAFKKATGNEGGTVIPAKPPQITVSGRVQEASLKLVDKVTSPKTWEAAEKAAFDTAKRTGNLAAESAALGLASPPGPAKAAAFASSARLSAAAGVTQLAGDALHFVRTREWGSTTTDVAEQALSKGVSKMAPKETRDAAEASWEFVTGAYKAVRSLAARAMNSADTAPASGPASGPPRQE